MTGKTERRYKSITKRTAIVTACALLAAATVDFSVITAGISGRLPETVVTLLPSVPVAQAAPPPVDAAGRELSRQREEAERERVRQQIRQDREQRGTGVRDETKQGETKAEDEVRFRLAGVTSDPSDILAPETVQALAAFYIGRDVSLSDLTELVQKINDVYAEKGYVTCKAYLPPQTIENGSVHIGLMEGKTGDISLSGNRNTRADYIRGRLPLREGAVQNFNGLNDSLYRFNATNDAQLGITVKAGKEPGTSDYEIAVREPKQDVFTLFADNAGSASTGAWREGLNYTNRSLSGRRDSATVGYVRAKGQDSVNLNYTAPVGRRGARILLDYSTASSELIEQSWRQFDIHGHSWSLSAAWVQPLIVNRTTRTEARFGVYRQNSQTDMLGGTQPWLDSRNNNLYGSFSMTSYGKSSVFYHQHYVGAGRTNFYRANTGDYASKNYALYRLNGFYQKTWKNGHALSGRLGLQWRGTRDLPSAEQFFMGGLYSVRGYKQDSVGGDSGVTFSAEYAVPVDRKRALSLYGFFDYGSLWGRSAYEDHVLKSVGFGLKGNICRQVFMNLAAGFPLERSLNGSRASRARVHLGMNAQF